MLAMTLTSRFGSPYTYNSKATICTQFLIQCRHKYRHTYSLFSEKYSQLAWHSGIIQC